MKTVDDYKGLVTSEYQGSTNFLAMIQLVASAYVQVQTLLLSMVPIFDVDTAVGDQLDIIGQWVGFSREIVLPITNVFFTWDDDGTLGWDFGVWQGDQVDVTSLPDDVYRNFIKAKIAANQWDGTTDGAYSIWDAVFTDVTILIQDNQDMTYSLAFVNGIVDALTLAVITGGFLPLRPEGVLIDQYYFPVDSNPLFGWDLEAEFVAGWDEGSWPKVVSGT